MCPTISLKIGTSDVYSVDSFRKSVIMTITDVLDCSVGHVCFSILVQFDCFSTLYKCTACQEQWYDAML